MAKRIVTRIGNIFCVEIDSEYKVYFQYIANDMSQLNSSVIRVFKQRYPLDANPKMNDIVKDDVGFYAHTILRVGIEYNAWYKVGRSNDLGLDQLSKVWFGSVPDSIFNWEKMQSIPCNPEETLYVWHVNERRIRVDKSLQNHYDNLEPGSVVPFMVIISRIKYGYDPGSENLYYHTKRVPWDDVDSYTKLEDSESEDVAYLHFVGKKAVAIVIVTPNGKVYLDEQHPKSGEFKMFEGDFGDINWKYNEFITAEEFKEAWGDHKW